MRLAAALVAATLVLSGCSSVPPPGRAQIDVDTPELREIRRATDIAACEPGSAEPGGGGLPEVTLPCLGGGESVDLSTLEGPLVVNLWAAWCGPCRTEMPILQDFHEQYGDRVPLIGVDYQDNQPLAALELARDVGVTYPLLADPQADLLGTEAFKTKIRLPMFAFVDESGEVTVMAAGIERLDELTGLVEDTLGIAL